MSTFRIVVICASLWTSASVQAFAARWMLGDATAVRTTASAAARTEGAEAASAANVARSATVANRAGASAARFCVRPRTSPRCVYRNAGSAESAAQQHVGSSYRVRATSSPNVFEVLDAVNNVVDILESISAFSESDASSHSDYSSGGTATRTYDSEVRRAEPAPLQLELRQGLELAQQVGGVSHVVWANGPVMVAADQNPHRVPLSAGERLRFDNANLIRVLPRSSQATTVFFLRTDVTQSIQRDGQRIQPAEGEVFRYGTPTMCPQVPIGNGMARCQ